MNENIYAFFSFIWMKKVILELNTKLKSRLLTAFFTEFQEVQKPHSASYGFWAILCLFW